MAHFERERLSISRGKLLRLLPGVLRARDFHLYIENGKRLTDLWLQGGRAIFGHKPPRVLGELKNAAERGLFTPLPHPMERRFIKALAGFFPDRAFRLYLNEGSLCQAIAGYENVPLWRPFLEPPDIKAPVLIPVLPWPLGPEVLVLEKGMDASFPAGELIPPVLLAPAARALYDLASALKAPGQGRQRYRKIEKVLGGQNAETGIWSSRGIYLTVKPDVEIEKYEALFRRFLEGGFLIPPSPEEPVILPSSMSDGEESKLAELLSF
jgi:hypothetical protein